MKVRKILAVLSALTIMSTSTLAQFPLLKYKTNEITASAIDNTSLNVEDFISKAIVKSSGDYKKTEAGLLYSINERNSTVTICGYEGDGVDIVIPETIDDYPVASINNNAFDGNIRIKSIDLGKVQRLGYHVFRGCKSLKEITIPNTVTTTGDSYFGGFLDGSYIEKVIFEEGIKNIPAYVCKNASSVKTVVLPEVDNNEEGYIIGDGAFEGTSISSIQLPESLTRIGESAFGGCILLKEIVIPNQVTEISNNSFAGCIRLEKINLSSKLEKMGYCIFQGCTSLKELTIPNTVTTTRDSYYGGCLEGSNIEKVIFEEGIKNIPAYVCKNASSLKTVVLPEIDDNKDGYTIGDSAFEGTSISSVQLPESLTKIGESAFSGCTLLKEITIPNQVTEISKYCFAGCIRLENIKLSSELKKMGSCIFNGCTSLKELTIPNTVTTTGDSYYGGCLEGSNIEKVIFEEGIKNIPAYVCKKATKLKTVILPESEDTVEGYTIENNAFESSSIASIELPESLTKIGESAFSGCTLLKEIVIPNQVMTISSNSFAGCIRLEKINLSSKLEKMGSCVFDGCTSLKEITIPSTVTSTGDSYYGGCLEGSGIEKVVFEEGIKNIPAYICKNAAKLKTAVLPESEDTVEGYAIGDNAFEGTSISSIELPESLTKIGKSAFSGCTLMKEIIIPNQVTEISGYCFENCNQLSNIALSSSLEKMGSFVFKGCTSLKEITIPNTVTSTVEYWDGSFEESSIEKITFEKGIKNIPSYVCKNATKLKTVVLPESDDTIEGYAIGDYAFENTSISSIKLPESLTKIGESAFSGCTLIKEIVIPDQVTEISESCFENCNQLSNIVLSSQLEKMGRLVFNGCTSLKEITIPSSVKSTGDRNAGCLGGSSIEKVTFEKGIKNIPAYVCNGASSVKTVVLPESEDNVEGYAIGAYAFKGTSISSVKLPESLTRIGESAFSECTLIKEIVIPDQVTEISSCCFENCNKLSNIVMSSNLERIGYYAFKGCNSLKSLSIPNTFKNTNNSDYYRCLEESNIETVYFENGLKEIPDYFAINCTSLKTVHLPETVETIGRSSFENCKNLSKISSVREKINFKNTSFYNCISLNDPRFTVLDSDNTYLYANSDRVSVNGIVNYTLKYKLMDSFAADAKNIYLSLDIPSGMTLLLDSVQSDDIIIDTADINYGTIKTKATEGTLKFSVRIVETGNYNILANLNFNYNGSSWREKIGYADIKSPTLTINSAETVNEAFAYVNGISQNSDKVSIYVNDSLATTLEVSPYTSKYQGKIELPNVKDGAVYNIYAESGDIVSDSITVTYESKKPVVEKVIMKLRGANDIGIDITSTFKNGISPVISYNPSNQLRFEVYTSNTDKIKRLFVTSTKSDNVKYLEANYDSEIGAWVAEGFFDKDNHYYVPGSLNISILEKETILLDDSYDYEIDQKFENVPDDYANNSSVKLVEKTDNGFIADIDVSDGEKSNNFQIYSNDNQDGIYYNGKYVSIEQVSKNPESYGFVKSNVQTVKDGKKVNYYTADAKSEDILATLHQDLSDDVGVISDLWSGKIFLEEVVGDNVAFKLANAFISDATADAMEEIFGSTYGSISNGLSVFSDGLSYISQLERADGNGEYIAAASLLFGIKCLNTFGTEALLAACGIVPPFSTLVKFGIDLALDSVDDYLNYCIENNEEFSLSGYIRFIIDPSGIIFEAVLSNTVEGATVTIYYKDTETGKTVKWNAEDYEQINPIITQKDGIYLWDVPEGEWKVVCEKEGYEKAETEWMTVPPVRTEVNIGLINKDVAKIEKATMDKEDGITLTFSKYMDISTVDSKNITINGYDGKYTVTPVLTDENDMFAESFVLKGDFTNDVTSLVLSSDIKCYAGISIEKKEVSVDKTERPTTTVTTTTTKPTTTTTKTTTTTTAKPTTTTTKTTTTTTAKPTTTTTKTTTTTTAKPTTTTTKTTTTTTAKPTTTTTKATTTTTAKPTTTTTTKTTTTTAKSTTTATTTSGNNTETTTNLGDINKDNVIDASDASMALIVYASVSTGDTSILTPELVKSADITQDGVVDATDASAILKYYAYVSTGGKDSIKKYFDIVA